VSRRGGEGEGEVVEAVGGKEAAEFRPLVGVGEVGVGEDFAIEVTKDDGGQGEEGLEGGEKAATERGRAVG
jgi:hypothetical protein